MPTVRIRVLNDTAEPVHFNIFNEFSNDSTSVGQAWQTVWAVSPSVDAVIGLTTFNITEDYYAICDMSSQSIGEGVTVQAENQLKVTLAAESKSGSLVPMLAKEGGVFFDEKSKYPYNVVGSYEIETAQWDAQKYALAFLGLGRANPAPNPAVPVTPVAVVKATAQQKYQLTPTAAYYISTGKLIEGTVVDLDNVGHKVRIDFTNKQENLATVHLQPGLKYSPVEYMYVPEK